ncbi:hypothetical protein J45TS6_19000 [Paenibacillus sp. J45TS6]|nr:hypothetical protein J45TS6_19000 [Paenibacillus sp. J45TS6]
MQLRPKGCIHVIQQSDEMEVKRKRFKKDDDRLFEFFGSAFIYRIAAFWS